MSRATSVTLDEDYIDMVSRLTCGPKMMEDWMHNATPESKDLFHAALGISGEAGELLDTIKKWVVYGGNLDVQNVIEELGDIEYYSTLARIALGITREDVQKCNIDKLRKRYPEETWTEEHCFNRDTLNEESVIRDRVKDIMGSK